MTTSIRSSAPEVWKRLAETYASRGLVLVLGAGVSAASGFPDWPALLQDIGARVLGDGGKQLVLDLQARGYSLPAIAGILEASVPGSAKFTELVRDALYAPFAFYRKSRRAHGPQIVADVQRTNSTLRAVGAMCAVRGDRNSFAPNKAIHAVVSLNLDALLQAYTAARYGERLLRTIERPSATASSSRINTYHIHGFLQFDSERVGDPESEADRIVFTEGEYYDFFGRPFGMFSYTMLHLLREHSCCFIGLSMIDENVRRLLHYSYTERVSSLLDEGASPDEASRRSRRHFALLKPTGNRAVDVTSEQSLARLGVEVAWYGDHPEIPARLGAVYAARGASWSDVYD